MAKIGYFKNARLDGTIRTGIEIDDEIAFELVQEGTDPDDPYLAWYVDVQCIGVSLPYDPEQARAWMLNHVEAIEAGIIELAEKISAGIDDYMLPQVLPDRPIPPDVSVRVRCMATRRVHAAELGVNLRAAARSLERELSALSLVPVPVS